MVAVRAGWGCWRASCREIAVTHYIVQFNAIVEAQLLKLILSCSQKSRGCWQQVKGLDFMHIMVGCHAIQPSPYCNSFPEL